MEDRPDPAPAQYDLIHDTEWDWLVILDACRWDTFAETAALEGELTAADNGGIGFTSVWFSEMFPDEYDLALFNPQPIHHFEGGPSYDERAHFAFVPGMTEFEWDPETATIPPAHVVDVVTAYLGGAVEQRLEALGYAASDVPNRGVIRFMQPHPPFREMVELTKGRADRHQKVAQAIAAGDITVEDVRAAYADNLEWALTVIAEDLLGALEGDVVVTADHGELLGENGEWFHRGDLGEYSAISLVPWFEVAR